MTYQEIHSLTLRSEPSGRFQPTGFPDLGAARYEQPVANGGSVMMLLVESVQSMANHLESVGWDDLKDEPVAALIGLPWVRVIDDGEGNFLTSSRIEPHRLASAYIRNSHLGSDPFLGILEKRFGLARDRRVDHRRMARAIFQLDPLSLIHGVFFAVGKWPHQPKFTRALTAFIEAEDVREVHSGGVKTDDVRHSVAGQGPGGGTAEGYGMVPHHRLEYTAANIKLHIALDLGLLASYGLSDPAVELLNTIARWELGSLLSAQLRLRTACTFRLESKSPESMANPSVLAERIAELANNCPELNETELVTEVKWNSKGKL